MATKTKTQSKINVRPLHDKINVKRAEPESVTESGIYLPESSKDKPKSGTVQAIGDGRLNTETGERIPLTVQSGDRVLFTSYAGTEIKLDGVEMLILDESEVLAVVD